MTKHAIGSFRFAALGMVLLSSAVGSGATYNVADLGQFTPMRRLNAAGHVVGHDNNSDSSQYHAIYYDGSIHDLGLGVAEGINANDQVVGYDASNSAARIPFLYDGSRHALGAVFNSPPSPFTFPRDINDAGQVVGYSGQAAQGGAFRYDLSDISLHSLGGAFISEANAISSNGLITGYENGGGTNAHAFFYNTSLHDLGTLGGNISQGLGINSLGQIVGSSNVTNNGQLHGFLYDGSMHDLGSFIPQGINASSLVVGSSPGATTDVATLYDTASGLVDLNTLINPLSGWTLDTAVGINNSGQITGTGTFNGASHAFLLTPVPEPSTFVLAAVGLASLVAWGCGHRRWPRCLRNSRPYEDQLMSA